MIDLHLRRVRLAEGDVRAAVRVGEIAGDDDAVVRSLRATAWR